MKIVIPGGSGQIGTLLARAFHARGDQVVILSRTPKSMPWKTVPWDAATLGPWTDEIDGADVVINMAGRSVNCRYNAKNRRDMMNSRVESTRAVGEAIRRSMNPPRVWLQASTATIYSHRYDAPNDELTGIVGGAEPNAPETWRFSIDVATAWERAALEAPTLHTRLVLLRSAMTMSPDRGGVFDVLMTLVRRGLGGRNGDGTQFVSWIHDADFVRAIDWLIEHDLSGPVNVCSPTPIPNADFLRILRQAAGVRVGLPATRWMLEIGAFFLRTETELILKSRRVVPRRLLDAGFAFQFADWQSAATDLCQRWFTQARGSAQR